jgi:hypothetical protein
MDQKLNEEGELKKRRGRKKKTNLTDDEDEDLG